MIARETLSIDRRDWAGPPVEVVPFFLFRTIGEETPLFRIKICGVLLEKDIAAVDTSAADAIGLNFYPPSIRYLDPLNPKTAELSGLAKSAGLLRVGVFVNESVSTLVETHDRVGLDAIQLHGDESLSTANELIALGHRVIRAIKLPRHAMLPDQIHAFASPWLDIGCHLLLDADAGAAHGGSGKTLDWNSVHQWAATFGVRKWTLAGGLKAENVARAVDESGAVSVDTASGVECPKGVKNADRIAAFAAAAGL